MNKHSEIRVPRETVNDDFVTIAKWRFAAGERVGAKEVLAELETSKAIIEVETDGEGFLEILAPEGAQVEVGGLIACLHAEAPPADPNRVKRQETASGEGASGPRFSRGAQALIDKHGIDRSVFAGMGLVREVDVLQLLDEPQSGGGDRADLEAEKPGIEEPLGFFSDARAAARDRNRNVVRLALDYAFRNYLLGHLARISPLGINLLVHRLRGVRIGKGVFIDPSATIETAYPENVTIGNDVRVTANAIIMTHIKAPHHLRETRIMPLVIKPVVLEDHCFVGVGAVIMPGVTVGKGAVVTSGSVVVTNVLPYEMVAGNPARVIRRLSSAAEP